MKVELTPGTRMACPACTTEVVVVAAPSAAATVTCGGVEMVAAGADRATDAAHTAASEAGVDAALLGKRYVDDDTGMELLCAKAGEGALAADGRAMGVKGAKPLPASD